MNQIELQELVLQTVKANQPISPDELIAEIQKSYRGEGDEIRVALFPLVSVGEIVFDGDRKLILSEK